MKSKTSFFKISPALIKEDFRKLWAIPVLAFIAYFLCGIFYILVNYKHLSEPGYGMAYYIDSLLTGTNPFYTGLFIGVPILSVLLIFRYLHVSGHVVSAHSQPFTRANLLNSHALSCMLFTVLPILATGIVMLIISHPTYYSADYYSSQDEMINVFARARILRWMLESVIVTLYVLVISLIGGMITGTSLHHAIAAIGFNGVVPLCALCLTLYFETYLFGYSVDGNFMEAIAYISPVSGTYMGDFMSVKKYFIYALVIIALYVFSMFLYYRRKLERASDGIVFKAFDIAITLIFGYLGMTALGMTFYAIFNQSKGVTTFGYFAGAILGMIICRMIIMKTIKVFNKTSFKIMASYLIIAVIFILGVGLDITGYEDRVADNAGAAGISMDGFYQLTDTFDYGSYMTFDSEESVKAVQDIQKIILENKEICIAAAERNDRDDGSSDYVHEDMSSVNIRYYKNADDRDAIEQRSYRVPTYLLFNSDAVKSLLNSQEFRDKMIESIPAEDEVVSATLTPGYYTSGRKLPDSISTANQEDAKSLRAAVEADMKAVSYEEHISAYNTGLIASIDFIYNAKQDDKNIANAQPVEEARTEEITETYTSEDLSKSSPNKQLVSTKTVTIYPSYANTLKWIEDHGYTQYFKIDGTQWDFATVKTIGDGGNVENRDESYDSLPAESSTVHVITDPEQMAQLFTKASSHLAYGAADSITTAEDNIYYVTFYTKEESESGSYYQDFSAYVKAADLPN